ncbi:MAG: DNA/RNA nuclease SfsA [Proteobacteria bacterium]|nr:DNA/RNA nuclease SfsA [Pseudomonadota bacterium]
MLFASPLTDGILIKRYKRFLADIQLADGNIVTAHCPNTGTMLTCSSPGSAVCLSTSANPGRKYPYTLEMVKVGPTWVGVNTARTNGLVTEAIMNGQIAELSNVDRIASEVKTSSHTRLDLHLRQGKCSTYVEIKNCSLAIDGCAMFPDAVTTRGAKHLQELTRLAKEGLGAAIFFLVQRMDAYCFAPATHIDPDYGKALQLANAAGVRIIVYRANVSPEGIHVDSPLPFSNEKYPEDLQIKGPGK